MLFYFLIAFGAATIGALTGMGGGVIIKPLMDTLQDFSVENIGVLSSITVFSMSVVSIGKQLSAKTPIPGTTVLPLAAGSVVGGCCGQWILRTLVDVFSAQSLIIVIQNSVLSVLVLCVYLYMRNKSNIPGKTLEGSLISLCVGCFLGICSSFLGIGGGPINVALIVYLYSVSTKTATVFSLVTILFAQLSKLLSIAITTGFSMYDLSVAPTMVVGGIAGGFLGTMLNRHTSESDVEAAFNAVQLLVLTISVFNILRNFAGT